MAEWRGREGRAMPPEVPGEGRCLGATEDWVRALRPVRRLFFQELARTDGGLDQAAGGRRGSVCGQEIIFNKLGEKHEAEAGNCLPQPACWWRPQEGGRQARAGGWVGRMESPLNTAQLLWSSPGRPGAGETPGLWRPGAAGGAEGSCPGGNTAGEADSGFVNTPLSAGHARPGLAVSCLPWVAEMQKILAWSLALPVPKTGLEQLTGPQFAPGSSPVKEAWKHLPCRVGLKEALNMRGCARDC